MDQTTILLLVIGALLIGGYFWYMSLIGRRNKALEALSSIDVQLRKRHDLLPNILKLASRFMKHERDLLDRLTALRAKVQETYRPQDPDAVQDHLKSESDLQSGMLQFFAVAENYPDLKSHETIVRAQETFTEVEGHISAARRFYNSAVTDLNNAVQIFSGQPDCGNGGCENHALFRDRGSGAQAGGCQRLFKLTRSGIMQFDESHPRLKGFNAYYEKTIRPGLKSMEARRIQAVRMGMIIFMPFLAAAGVLAYIGLFVPTQSEDNPFLGLAGACVAGGWFLGLLEGAVGQKWIRRPSGRDDFEVSGAQPPS